LTTPSEAELEALLEAYPSQEGCGEVLKTFLGLTLEEFYNYFQKDGATMGFGAYYEEKGEKDIKLENWNLQEDGTELRQLDMIIAIKGVPFCKSSKCNKSQKMTRSE
jgi:hypothetical protein